MADKQHINGWKIKALLSISLIRGQAKVALIAPASNHQIASHYLFIFSCSYL